MKIARGIPEYLESKRAQPLGYEGVPQTLSQVITKYIGAKKAQRFSPNTLKDYNNAFRKLKITLGDKSDLRDITALEITDFLGQYTLLSKKTILNHHTALSSLWRWASEQGVVERNIVRLVSPPKPDFREIIPLSETEITLLLKSAKNGDYPIRDSAILLVFLDTGIRVSEMANIQLMDINWTGQAYIVTMGKGDKERLLPISATTVKALETYFVARNVHLPLYKHNGPLFLNYRGNPLTDSGIRKLLYRLSEQARIRRANPHRLRHTFAIWYLRLGGNIYALQKILGHSTLDMVKRYLAIAQTDIDLDHSHASPVTHLKLSQ